MWKNDASVPFRTFYAVQKAFTAKGKTVKFLMNAGIFEPGGIPSGIHIEASKEWLPLNERAGDGNFWDFAGLFLSLGCQNALFLDGDISQMAVHPDKPVESNQFGAMFVVAE